MYTYTPHQQEIRDKLAALKAEEGASLEVLKERIGLSKAALSQIINYNYKADPQNAFNTIEAYLNLKEKAKFTYSEIPYAETGVSTQIYNIISLCQVKGGLAVVAGDAGIGKTKAAQKFVENNPSNSILITVNPCISSVRSLLQELAERLGTPTEYTSNRLWKSIANKLNDGMILIFDESQHLTLKEIEVLRSFSDYFNDKGQTLGLCFVGNIDVMSKIGSKKAEFAQISNRTKQRKICTKSDITRDDIIKLFPVLEAEKKDKEIDFLLRVSHTPQALRGAINLFSNAYDNEDYSYKGLLAMAKFMDMAV